MSLSKFAACLATS